MGGSDNRWSGWEEREVGDFPPPCSGALCDMTYAWQPLLQGSKAPGIHFPTSFPYLLKHRMAKSSCSYKALCPSTLQVSLTLLP